MLKLVVVMLIMLNLIWTKLDVQQSFSIDKRKEESIFGEQGSVRSRMGSRSLLLRGMFWQICTIAGLEVVLASIDQSVIT
jgi:hypothetical protein